MVRTFSVERGHSGFAMLIFVVGLLMSSGC
jgi:hypothetical protein